MVDCLFFVEDRGPVVAKQTLFKQIAKCSEFCSRAVTSPLKNTSAKSHSSKGMDDFIYLFISVDWESPAGCTLSLFSGGPGENSSTLQ